MPRNAVDLFHRFNTGRNPERLALKCRAMVNDPCILPEHPKKRI
jgi:hypothetical protein